MPMLRITTCLALLVALSGWKHTASRKEMLRVEVRSASGVPVSVHLQSRGLVIIPEHPTVARLPTTTDTSIVTPATLRFAGVGEAEIEAVTAAQVLVVEATELRENAAPPRRLKGRVFRISRATYAEPYHVAVIESPTSPRR